MFGKTTLFKVGFVVVILALVGFLVAAPSLARAFFQGEGQSGWIARLMGVSDDAGESKPAEIEAKSVSAVKEPSLDDNSNDASDNNNSMSDDGNSNDTNSNDANSNDDNGNDANSNDDNGNDNGTDDNGNENSDDAGMSAEIEFVGKLSAKEGTTWTVGGVLVTVNEKTEVKGMLDLGSLVKVEGTHQADGSVLAREIKLAEDDDQEGEIEFVGELTAKDGSTWMVGGMTVLVTQATELYSGLEIGAVVKVEGMLVEGGLVQAREIKRWSPDDDDNGNGNDDNGNDNDDNGNVNDDDNGNDNDDNGNANDDNGNDNDDDGNDNDDNGNANDDNGNDNDDDGNDNDDNGNDNDDDGNDNDDDGNDNDD